MRVYALLLGVVLTAGYGFAAQVAVSSAAAGGQSHAAPAPAAAVASQTLDPIWYGGMIDPITVESGGTAVRATVSKSRTLGRSLLRCTATPQPAYRAVS
jgi:hypothetical protein